MWTRFSQSYEKVVRVENRRQASQQRRPCKLHRGRSAARFIRSARQRKNYALSARRFCPRGFPQKSRRRIEETPCCAPVLLENSRHVNFKPDEAAGKGSDEALEARLNFFLVVAHLTTVFVKMLSLNFACLVSQYLRDNISLSILRNYIRNNYRT